MLIFSPAPASSMRALLTLIVLASMLAGCGYKGPLYLPKPKAEAKKPASPPAPPPQPQKAEE
jgi:predicted small lipoprotein YifL